MSRKNSYRSLCTCFILRPRPSSQESKELSVENGQVERDDTSDLLKLAFINFGSLVLPGSVFEGNRAKNRTVGLLLQGEHCNLKGDLTGDLM